MQELQKVSPIFVRNIFETMPVFTMTALSDILLRSEGEAFNDNSKVFSICLDGNAVLGVHLLGRRSIFPFALAV